MHDDRGVRAISIFDLDRTLTRRPTYLLFLLTGAARTAPLRLLFLPLILIAMIGHKLGLIGRKPLKEFMQRLLLGSKINRISLAKLTNRFVCRLLENGLYPSGLAQLATDRTEGRQLILATAAPDFYADAIAARLGFDAVVSTRCRLDADHLFSCIEGANCYGRDKLHAIEAWLWRQGWMRDRVHVRFYSDDRSDLPTFDWCDEPVVVNARASFATWAGKRGWAIADWRTLPITAS